MAILMSLGISLVFGDRIISSLRKLQVGETVRDLGLDGQKEKEGTPTMGGLMILISILIPTILFARLDNIYVLLLLFATVWFAAIGFLDDRLKILRKNKDGLRGKYKILGQVFMGLIVALTMLMHQDIVVRVPALDAQSMGWEITKYLDSDLEGGAMVHAKAPITNVPFLKDNELDYSIFVGKNLNLLWLAFIPIVIFIITAVSNAANLTDGLDGLLTGIGAIIGATLAVLAWVSGNAIVADYLNILFIPSSQEIVIYASCFIGATIGFLWYNSYPASVFMGDTGSLMIGGVIAVMAVMLRKEILIPILCGILLVESLSVIMQVTYFKYTKRRTGTGQRIFLMSPLHHHYQKKGWHEMKIVIRFWILAILLAVLTIITLKLR
jgi:phospho-N-acetylmuramoyl-pentapeptide-transferase